jgi:hypothetical protein
MAQATSGRESTINTQIATTLNKGNTGDDKRNEATIVALFDSNWESMLQPAPYSIALLGQLILVSSGKDFSLVSDDQSGDTAPVTQPHSFRATLVQVSNDGYHAFNIAHSNMDKIRLSSEMIPDQIKRITITLLKGTSEEIAIILPPMLEGISESAKECKDWAMEVEQKFLQVMVLVEKTLQLCTGAQNKYQKDYQEKTAILKVSEEREKMLSDTKKAQQALVARIEKDIDEAKVQFSKAENDMPGLGTAISMHLIYYLLKCNDLNFTTFS